MASNTADGQISLDQSAHPKVMTKQHPESPRIHRCTCTCTCLHAQSREAEGGATWPKRSGLAASDQKPRTDDAERTREQAFASAVAVSPTGPGKVAHPTAHDKHKCLPNSSSFRAVTSAVCHVCFGLLSGGTFHVETTPSFETNPPTRRRQYKRDRPYKYGKCHSR